MNINICHGTKIVRLYFWSNLLNIKSLILPGEPSMIKIYHLRVLRISPVGVRSRTRTVAINIILGVFTVAGTVLTIFASLKG